jgi:hypothetical protein
MTPDEADKRILVSQTTLTRYVKRALRMQWPTDVLPVFHDEIAILEQIAEGHPGKASRIIVLVSQWVAFRDSLRAKLN